MFAAATDRPQGGYSMLRWRVVQWCLATGFTGVSGDEMECAADGGLIDTGNRGSEEETLQVP